MLHIWSYKKQYTTEDYDRFIYKSVVFLAGAATDSITPMSAIYLYSGGHIILG